MRSGDTREFMALYAIAQPLRKTRNPSRSGLGGEPQRAPQDREPAPARDPRPGHPARRTRHHPTALQRGEVAPRHRICLPKRRTRRTRKSDPQSPPSRARTIPTRPACLARPEPADSTHPGSRRCWLIERDLVSQSQKHVSPANAQHHHKRSCSDTFRRARRGAGWRSSDGWRCRSRPTAVPAV